MNNGHSIRQYLVAGNWKLNGSRSGVVSLAEQVAGGASQCTAEVLVCPSFVHLSDVLGVVGNSAIHLGAQDCHEINAGAYTGETSPEMLVEFGVEYVIVGHSERRQMFADTDERVARKFVAVQNAGLTPILCVGETLEQREAEQVDSVIKRQIDAVLELPATGSEAEGVERFRNAVIAYEPVWAIGTGRTATPEQAQAVHAMIREHLSVKNSDIAGNLRILYGGSVNAGNASSLFAMPDIDGALVGGASLKAEEFCTICLAATNDA